jgi:hypothetical protein
MVTLHGRCWTYQRFIKGHLVLSNVLATLLYENDGSAFGSPTSLSIHESKYAYLLIQINVRLFLLGIEFIRQNGNSGRFQSTATIFIAIRSHSMLNFRLK